MNGPYFGYVQDEFGKMKEEIPMAVLEARVKKATEEMETELKVEGKEGLQDGRGLYLLYLSNLVNYRELATFSLRTRNL